jgi:hypothetical protein
MPRVLRLALAVMTTLAITSTASATVMVEVPLEELILRADVIVHARVVESRVRLEMRSGALEPQTFTTLEVLEWVAGPGGRTVELRELGGVWQGGGLHFEGTPEYQAGEEVVVFLERRPEAPHDLRTLAMAQGKFEVRHGVPGVPASVCRDLSGVAFARWADGQQTVHAPGEEPAMELGVFLDFVRRTRRSR